jgi:hypothetical protein
MRLMLGKHYVENIKKNDLTINYTFEYVKLNINSKRVFKACSSDEGIGHIRLFKPKKET